MTWMRKRPHKAGADLRLAAGDQCSDYMTRVAQSIAFWRYGDFKLPSKWIVRPELMDDGETFICLASMPCEASPHRSAMFIWEPSGFLQEVGTFPGMLAGPLASELARVVPGAAVMDGRF